LYGPAMVLENRKKVLYVEVLKAIYGMLEAALLWYKTFRKDLEDIGFIFNPYDHHQNFGKSCLCPSFTMHQALSSQWKFAHAIR
jgi:hypothetical protein